MSLASESDVYRCHDCGRLFLTLKGRGGHPCNRESGVTPSPYANATSRLSDVREYVASRLEAGDAHVDARRIGKTLNIPTQRVTYELQTLADDGVVERADEWVAPIWRITLDREVLER